jgi:intein/homing endonuclease
VEGSWQRAEYLKPGSLLRSLVAAPLEREGRTMMSEDVKSLVELPGVDTVYNLEIEHFHTYFAEGLLVHNVATKH